MFHQKAIFFLTYSGLWHFPWRKRSYVRSYKQEWTLKRVRPFITTSSKGTKIKVAQMASLQWKKESEVWSCKENLQKGLSEEAELLGFIEFQLYFVPCLGLYNVTVEISCSPQCDAFFFFFKRILFYFKIMLIFREYNLKWRWRLKTQEAERNVFSQARYKPIL